jgi:macrolide transport system ATP-binding/permease protein
MIAILAQLGRDFASAARAIRRRPGLSAVVIGSLGLGIAANATVFSWFESRVLDPIPGVAGGARFHFIEPRRDSGGYPGMSWLEFLDIRRSTTTFDDVVAFSMRPLNVGPTDSAERVTGALVSDNYFVALGLSPVRGRFFDPALEKTSSPTSDPSGVPVIVISDDYWRTRLAGRESVVGEVFRVNDRLVTVVAVAPPRFHGTAMGLKFDVWVPARLAPVLFDGSRELESRGERAYSVLGAMRPEIARGDAERDVKTVMAGLARDFPQTNADVSAEVLAFWDSPRGPQRFLTRALAVLQAAMLLVLAAVCGNTANLLLARAASRRHEVAIRLALGAGRWRVVTLVLAECVLLGLLGAVVGVLLALWGTEAMRAVPMPRPGGMTVEMQTSISVVTLAFAGVLGLLCGVVFGLPPAIQLARAATAASSFRAAPAEPARSALRDILVVVEVALALVVLVVAAMFVQRFRDTRSTDPGFRRAGVVLASYDLAARTRIADGISRQFAARLLDRLQTLPGIDAAALAASVPLDIHGMPSRSFVLDGRGAAGGVPDRTLTNTVSPGYFTTMGIAFEAGSDFAPMDDVAAPPQAVVNATFQRRYRPEGVVGHWIETGGRRAMIVGVVADSLNDAYGEPPTPCLYLSLRDRPSSFAEIHVRTRPGAELAIVPELRRVVRGLDPTVPLYNVRSLDEHVEANLLFVRIPARLFAILGPVLLGLAAIGTYAVVSYAVSRRRAEIGLRIALGATPNAVVVRLVRDSLQVIGIGLAGGGLIALFIWRTASADGTGMSLLIVPILALAAVATLASWLPARRAAKVDPVAALRTDA